MIFLGQVHVLVVLELVSKSDGRLDLIVLTELYIWHRTLLKLIRNGVHPLYLSAA